MMVSALAPDLPIRVSTFETEPELVKSPRVSLSEPTPRIDDRRSHQSGHRT